MNRIFRKLELRSESYCMVVSSQRLVSGGRIDRLFNFDSIVGVLCMRQSVRRRIWVVHYAKNVVFRYALFTGLQSSYTFLVPSIHTSDQRGERKRQYESGKAAREILHNVAGQSAPGRATVLFIRRKRFHASVAIGIRVRVCISALVSLRKAGELTNWVRCWRWMIRSGIVAVDRRAIELSITVLDLWDSV